jgi:hypothetical protein
MPQNRFFLLPLLGCLTLTFAAVLGMPSLLPAPVHGEDNSAPRAPAPPLSQTLPVLNPATARPDAAASQTLEQALSRLSPPGDGKAPVGVTWLATNLWQQMQMQGLACEVQGRYLSGPNNCFRLDLATRQGDIEGKLCVVSNGQLLWQATRLGAQGWARANKVDLTQLRQVFPNQQPASPWDDYLQSQAGGGPAALLANLRRQLTWVRQEPVLRQGVMLMKLTGTWRPSVLLGLSPTGKSADGRSDWPSGWPRQCRLYLDARSLWPHRVEWWGPDPPRPSEALLMEMEFREPVVNRPLSAEQSAQLFTWHDGDVPDATREVLDQLWEKQQRR